MQISPITIVCFNNFSLVLSFVILDSKESLRCSGGCWPGSVESCLGLLKLLCDWPGGAKVGCVVRIKAVPNSDVWQLG